MFNVEISSSGLASSVGPRAPWPTYSDRQQSYNASSQRVRDFSDVAAWTECSYGACAERRCWAEMQQPKSSQSPMTVSEESDTNRTFASSSSTTQDKQSIYSSHLSRLYILPWGASRLVLVSYNLLTPFLHLLYARIHTVVTKFDKWHLNN